MPTRRDESSVALPWSRQRSPVRVHLFFADTRCLVSQLRERRSEDPDGAHHARHAAHPDFLDGTVRVRELVEGTTNGVDACTDDLRREGHEVTDRQLAQELNGFRHHVVVWNDVANDERRLLVKKIINRFSRRALGSEVRFTSCIVHCSERLGKLLPLELKPIYFPEIVPSLIQILRFSARPCNKGADRIVRPPRPEATVCWQTAEYPRGLLVAKALGDQVLHLAKLGLRSHNSEPLQLAEQLRDLTLRQVVEY